MTLEKIVLSPNDTDLYKVLSMSKSGFILESLTTKKKKKIPATNGISNLEEIIIYTNDGGNLNILEVFKKILKKESNQPVSIDKDNMKSYFNEVLPNNDKERVYTSHIKKILRWYNILLKSKVIFLEEKDNNNSAEQKEE